MPFDEWSRTKPHRHPFSASSSFCGTLLRFDCPNSSRISERISAAIAHEEFCTSLAFRLTPLAPFSDPLLSCTMHVSCYVKFNFCPLMVTSVEGSCIIGTDSIPKSSKFGTNVPRSLALTLQYRNANAMDGCNNTSMREMVGKVERGGWAVMPIPQNGTFCCPTATPAFKELTKCILQQELHVNHENHLR